MRTWEKDGDDSDLGRTQVVRGIKTLTITWKRCQIGKVLMKNKNLEIERNGRMNKFQTCEGTMARGKGSLSPLESSICLTQRNVGVYTDSP